MISKYFTDGVARKRTSAHVLFFNEAGEVLIVKPKYRDYWLVPGGLVENNESPLSGSIREVKEQIGLDVNVRRLLGIEYNPTAGHGGDGVAFVFYGGVLTPDQINSIVLADEDLSDFKFVSKDGIDLLLPRLQKRIPRCIESAQGVHVAYLEGGVMIF